MEFSKVVFYGRLGEQALKMFGLEGELPRWRGERLLDCPGGPGSLPAVLRSHGLDVTAVDPLYALPPAELRQRALEDLEHTMAIQAASDELRPDFDLQACRREHLQTLELFLADREAHPERYRAGALPELPFHDGHFDLVLSGHLLFAYAPCLDGGLMAGEGLDLAWHRRALAELCRVSSREVRLYPAHTVDRVVRRHPYAEALLAELPSGWRGRFVEVPTTKASRAAWRGWSWCAGGEVGPAPLDRHGSPLDPSAAPPDRALALPVPGDPPWKQPGSQGGCAWSRAPSAME